MKVFATVIFIFQMLVAIHAGSPDPASKPKREKFTLAPGTVSDSRNPRAVIEKDPRSKDMPEILELDPNEVTPAMSPDDMDHHRHGGAAHKARDRLGRRSCPDDRPWQCDGGSCFNRFTHNCCKGGLICLDPSVCMVDRADKVVCQHF